MSRHSEPETPAEVLERVLVLVNGARNARLTSELLGDSGIAAHVCTSVADLCAEIEKGGAAVLVAEEVLDAGGLAQLAGTLDRQPPWSDFPFVVFSESRGDRETVAAVPRILGNATFLDRPVRTRSMLLAVRAAIRSRRRQYEGRSAIESRDTFLAMLGHELRNPLGAVCLAAGALHRKLGAGTASKELEIIDRQAKHLTRLVDDLLDVARITHGKVVLKWQRLDLDEVVRSTCEALEPRACERGLSFELREAGSAIWIDGDRQRIEQIVNNLVANAMKYTPRGGAIVVSVGADHDAAVVSVADTGVGIALDMLERVFEAFAQAEQSLSRGEGGLGLGLTVVRMLVQLHRGSVEAKSAGPGRGSSFVVRLPVVAGAIATAGASNGGLEEHAPGRRVVVVEDSSDIRELFTELLQYDGHEVASADNGPRGLEAILNFSPDIAFVDLGLPGFDGLELARQARASGSRTRLVAVTGYGQAEDRHLAAEAGFDDHLTKPVDDDDIHRAMRALRGCRP